MMLFFFIFYVFTVLWYTVLKRSAGYRTAYFELFWSYQRWFSGDRALGREIMANIAMFLPFGFLLPSSLRRIRPYMVILSAAAFSLVIETLQLFLMRGFFEFDDLFSNTLGAVIGVMIYIILKGQKVFSVFKLSIGAVSVFVCAAVLIHGQGNAGIEADSSSRAYYFQIGEAVLDGDRLRIGGFCFRYGKPEGKPSIVLRPVETGKEVVLSTGYGTESREVNAYFLCDYDYSHAGFSAEGTVDPNTEYEIMIQWPWSPPGSSGVFIRGADVHYVPDALSAEPEADGTDLEEIVENGTLLVYRPDYHCWVYQCGGDLYWVADSDFSFEEDGTTYIQYQLWTTQIWNLPEKRLAHDNHWDNIGGYFEKYELPGDYGRYRVMKRELPDAYSVTSIVTGYYKNGKWIWKNYFRPVYEW